MDVGRFETTAQITVAVLLFWAGAEFPFRLIRPVLWAAIVCGFRGQLPSIALSLLVGQWLDWSTRQAFVLGLMLSLSSTIVLSNLTSDQGEQRSALQSASRFSRYFYCSIWPSVRQQRQQCSWQHYQPPQEELLHC